MKNKYLPLHHKYRPAKFDDLIGQEMIIKTLKQAIITNRIAPAYLFCGPRGTGKTSSARILARSLNCLDFEQPTIEPCQKCETCKAISNGTALDVIEIDAASNTGVDNIRDLIEKSRFAPVQSRWKVYVIDECHMLSSAAFNALLKTLEEPSPKSVFVLATTDPQRLLPTIISRCQRFDFRRISLEFLKRNLEEISIKEKININKEALNLIARRSEGGLRDAQRMLDQLSLLPQPIEAKSVWSILGEVSEKELISLLSALTKEDPILVIKICRNLIDKGNEPIAILEGLTTILRDLLIKKSAPNEPKLCSIAEDLHPLLKEVSDATNKEKILDWQYYLKGTESQIRQSYQPRLWLEVLLLGMLSNVNKKPIMKSKESILEPSQVDKKEIKKSSKELQESNRSRSNEIKVNTAKGISQTSREVQNAETSGLQEIWISLLTKIELPSTKMLLSQQARLTKLTQNTAEISVASNWIGMIESRKNILEEAIKKSLGTPRKIILKSEQKITSTKDSNLKAQKSASDNKKDPEEIEIKFDKNLNSEEQNISLNYENIDKQTKKFADFFNGEIIEP